MTTKMGLKRHPTQLEFFKKAILHVATSATKTQLVYFILSPPTTEIPMNFSFFLLGINAIPTKSPTSYVGLSKEHSCVYDAAPFTVMDRDVAVDVQMVLMCDNVWSAYDYIGN